MRVSFVMHVYRRTSSVSVLRITIALITNKARRMPKLDIRDIRSGYKGHNPSERIEAEQLLNHLTQSHSMSLLQPLCPVDLRSITAPVWAGWIRKSEWEVARRHCLPFEYPCRSSNRLMAYSKRLIITYGGYQSIENYRAAILGAIKTIFSTEYTEMHHLVTPAALQRHLDSSGSLQAEISAEATRIKDTLSCLMDMKFEVSPSRMFYEQTEVMEFAINYCERHFGPGDGIPARLTMIPEYVYIKALICAWHQRSHGGMSDISRSLKSYCCYCCDDDDAEKSAKQKKYVEETMAYHLFDAHRDKKDKPWRLNPVSNIEELELEESLRASEVTSTTQCPNVASRCFSLED